MDQPLNTTLCFGRPVAPGADPGQVRLCDLGNKGWQQKDIENALRLWRRPVVLIAGRNSLDRLPTNSPCSIIYLDLSWNRLTFLEGFAALPSLRELDVSHNGIQSMLGLVTNTDLRLLRMSYNSIQRIEGLHQLKRLKEADLSHNLLRTAVDVRALSLNSAIRRLRIEGNPFCTKEAEHGSYEVAIQHLVPGMSLLDGKPLPGLACPTPSLPSSPPVSCTLYHGVGVQPHRTISLEAKLAGCNDQGDISITRRWRELAIVTMGREDPIKPHEQVVKKTWSRTGGGGPTVEPGSYADIFQDSQRNRRRGAAVSPGPAAGSTAIVTTTTTAHTDNCGMIKEDRATVRRREAMRATVNSASRPINLRVREPTGPKAGDHDIDRISVGARRAHRAIYPPQNLLASHRGLTRVERAAARRLAWSQARYDDTLGPRTAQRRRTISRRAHASSARRSVTPQSLGAARLHGKRYNAESPLTEGQIHSSSRRRADGGVFVEMSRTGTSQVQAGGHRKKSVTTAEGGRGSSTDMVSRSGSTAKLVKKSRLLGIGSRSHNEDINAGAKRPGNGSQQTDSYMIVTRWNPSGRSARRSRVSAEARGHSGGGGNAIRAHNKNMASKGGRRRNMFHPSRTTLGQEGRRTPYPMLWQTSRCTPREDAKPWQENNFNSREASDCDYMTDHGGNKDLCRRHVTNEGVEMYAPLRLDEGGNVGIPPETEKRDDRFYHYVPNSAHYDYVTGNASDDIGGCGSGVCFRLGRGPSATSPFAPPSSAAAIVQQAPSVRSSAMSSATAQETRSGVAVASRACYAAESRTHHVNADRQERCAESVERRSACPRVSRAVDNWWAKSDNGSADNPVRYRIDDHHVSDDLVDEEEEPSRPWRGRNDPLSTPVTFEMPHYSARGPGAVTNAGRESHGRATPPEGYEVTACPHNALGDLSDWSDAGHPGGIKARISNQRQQRDAEKPTWRHRRPSAQLLSLERALAPSASEIIGRTTNTDGSGEADDAVKATSDYCHREPEIMRPIQAHRRGDVKGDTSPKEALDVGHPRVATHSDHREQGRTGNQRRTHSPSNINDGEEIWQGQDSEAIFGDEPSASFEELESSRIGESRAGHAGSAMKGGCFSTKSTPADGWVSERTGSQGAHGRCVMGNDAITVVGLKKQIMDVLASMIGEGVV